MFGLDEVKAPLLKSNIFKNYWKHHVVSSSQHFAEVLAKLMTVLTEASVTNMHVDIDVILAKFCIDVCCEMEFHVEVNALGGSSQYEEIKNHLRNIMYENFASSMNPIRWIFPSTYWYQGKGIQKSQDFFFKLGSLIFQHIKFIFDKGLLSSSSFGYALVLYSFAPGIVVENTNVTT